MTTENTQPIVDAARPINGMAAAVQVLADLIAQHPELPDAYITVHAPFRNFPSHFGLQLKNASDMEAWRSALGIDPMTVVLHGPGERSWITADTHVSGVKVDISGHEVRITPEQAAEPRTKTPVPVMTLVESLAAQALPTREDLAATVPCPACRVGARARCISRSGTPARYPHDARIAALEQAAGITQKRAADQRDRLCPGIDHRAEANLLAAYATRIDAATEAVNR